MALSTLDPEFAVDSHFKIFTAKIGILQIDNLTLQTVPFMTVSRVLSPLFSSIFEFK